MESPHKTWKQCACVCVCIHWQTVVMTENMAIRNNFILSKSKQIWWPFQCFIQLFTERFLLYFRGHSWSALELYSAARLGALFWAAKDLARSLCVINLEQFQPDWFLSRCHSQQQVRWGTGPRAKDSSSHSTWGRRNYLPPNPKSNRSIMGLKALLSGFVLE
jgi:hypothetical protein